MLFLQFISSFLRTSLTFADLLVAIHSLAIVDRLFIINWLTVPDLLFVIIALP